MEPNPQAPAPRQDLQASMLEASAGSQASEVPLTRQIWPEWAAAFPYTETEMLASAVWPLSAF